MKRNRYLTNTLSNIDFRFIPAIVLVIYFFTLIYCEVYLGSYTVISNFFGIYSIPYFVDLKVLLCGLDAAEVGADPYKAICYNGNPIFNYPIAWTIFSSIPFLDEGNLIYLGISMGVLVFIFIFLFIGKISLTESIIYSVIFISPAIILGIERGNCDLLIYMMLFIPFVKSKVSPITLGIVVLITSILKLYPIGALVGLLFNNNNKFNNKLIIFSTILLLFIVYLILFRENIAVVSSQTPRPFYGFSYGFGNIPSLLIKNFPSFEFLIIIGCVVLFVIQFFVLSILFSKSLRSLVIMNNNKGYAFIAGCCIFLITSVIGYNFEYRLVFLLFTIPQILIWLKTSDKLAWYLITITILLTWQSFIKLIFPNPLYYHLFSQILFVILFQVYVIILYQNLYFKIQEYILRLFKFRRATY